MALGQIEPVLGDVGVVFDELFVDPGGVGEVLRHIVAVGEEGHGPGPGAELELVVEVVDGLG